MNMSVPLILLIWQQKVILSVKIILQTP